jgi:serine phosphatase RsbU (regulator of sigma subunit)
VLLRSGVVGYQLPTLRASTLPIAPGDLLIFATDGIGARRIHGRFGAQ